MTLTLTLIGGLVTIRALRHAEISAMKLEDQVAWAARPHFLFLAGSRWVGIRLDLVANVLVSLACCLVVVLGGHLSAGLAGVVLTQAHTLNPNPNPNPNPT